MRRIRVLLADDHVIVRSGLRALLERMQGVEVVGEASTGRETIALVASRRPNVVLLDITMPDLSGLDAAAHIMRDSPRTRVLVLSMHQNEEYVAQALRVGAAGYLLKCSEPAEVEVAIRAVARGELYLSAAISRPLVEAYLRRVGGESTAAWRLTSRQREILQLIAEGKSTKEIAGHLKLSPKTVDSHRTAIMERLDIHDIAGLVRYAVRSGLVPADR